MSPSFVRFKIISAGSILARVRYINIKCFVCARIGYRMNGEYTDIKSWSDFLPRRITRLQDILTYTVDIVSAISSVMSALTTLMCKYKTFISFVHGHWALSFVGMFFLFYTTTHRWFECVTADWVIRLYWWIIACLRNDWQTMRQYIPHTAYQ